MFIQIGIGSALKQHLLDPQLRSQFPIFQLRNQSTDQQRRRHRSGSTTTRLPSRTLYRWVAGLVQRSSLSPPVQPPLIQDREEFIADLRKRKLNKAATANKAAKDEKKMNGKIEAKGLRLLRRIFFFGKKPFIFEFCRISCSTDKQENYQEWIFFVK